MTAIEIAPAAERDLEDIWFAIASERPVVADRIVGEIIARMTRLSDLSRMGPRRPEIATSTRVLVQGRHLILYATIPDTDIGPVEAVRILRVVDGRRDLNLLW